MNTMVVENKRIERSCCFYVSDFHLEMILVPYINTRIEEKENITILTERKLRETLEILLAKMNLKEESKQRILELGWNQENKIEEDSNIIIIGSEKYIEEKNKEIENIKNKNIIDCYNFSEVKDNINNIINRYEKSLNTLGNDKF